MRSRSGLGYGTVASCHDHRCLRVGQIMRAWIKAVRGSNGGVQLRAVLCGERLSNGTLSAGATADEEPCVPVQAPLALGLIGRGMQGNAGCLSHPCPHSRPVGTPRVTLRSPCGQHKLVPRPLRHTQSRARIAVDRGFCNAAKTIN